MDPVLLKKDGGGVESAAAIIIRTGVALLWTLVDRVGIQDQKIAALFAVTRGMVGHWRFGRSRLPDHAQVLLTALVEGQLLDIESTFRSPDAELLVLRMVGGGNRLRANWREKCEAWLKETKALLQAQIEENKKLPPEAEEEAKRLAFQFEELLETVAAPVQPNPEVWSTTIPKLGIQTPTKAHPKKEKKRTTKKPLKQRRGSKKEV